MDKKKTVQVGGQAVIEGVMMRSPEFVSVAVRKPGGKIALKQNRYVSWTKRWKFFGWPLVRGGVILIESLVLGIKALNFSADVAMSELENDKGKQKSKKQHTSGFRSNLSIVVTMVIAFGLGILIFFYIPLLLTELTGIESGILFNIIDGLIRLLFFLVYLVLISQWKEIRRVFEYHGAEHKSIFAYEAGRPLTLDGIKSFSTHHPRCGTSFLLVVMLVALIVFIFLGKPQDWGDRFIRFLFIPVIGGISYEIIRFSGTKYGSKIAQILVAPGLWLQRITTKEPDDSQLGVAIVALKSALNQEIDSEIEIVSS
jgi:uncharacterized protein YqhQ